MKALLHKTKTIDNGPVWGVVVQSFITKKYVVKDRNYPFDCVFEDEDTIEQAEGMFEIDLSDYKLVKFSIVPE